MLRLGGRALAVGLSLLAAAANAAHPVAAKRAMVVAQEPLATDVGVEILRSGGNAVDAAVAVGFALAVTLPSAGNLGGGGFLLARFADGRAAFIDFRERAPEKATRDMYLDDHGRLTEDSLTGWRAAAVPGSVRGLEHAHRKFGRKPWTELLTPAIRLARQGFPVSYALADSLRTSARLAKFSESRRIFLKNGEYFSPGETIVQADLAGTLERIAKSGSAEFYGGETARRLVAEMSANGGLFTLADLKGYKVVERAPLTGGYRGYELITAPPPSSGGVGVLQMLGMLEGSGYDREGPGSASAIHYVAEVMRRYYADRSEHLADPDFHRVPVAGLLARPYLEQRRNTIDPARASSSDAIRPGDPAPAERAETTHLSIVDAEGNAVALTYTLNGGYGSGVTVPGLGFLLNNEMDDFSAKPGEPNMFALVQGEANAIQPGKRPLSSMTPTIVLRDGRLFMTLGAPGGSRIITGVMQVLLNALDFGMNVQDAVNRPRFHHQWKPDELYMEEGFSPDTIALLRGRGHKVASTAGVALVEAIQVKADRLEGATDPRGHGKAAGY
ncbi:MAG: gamma-glutamyltransferase [Bryobacteraceae bacterium]|nr:gamma-glutamyltransferase [Bryobacteraceae bacterium]